MWVHTHNIRSSRYEWYIWYINARTIGDIIEISSETEEEMHVRLLDLLLWRIRYQKKSQFSLQKSPSSHHSNTLNVWSITTNYYWYSFINTVMSKIVFAAYYFLCKSWYIFFSRIQKMYNILKGFTFDRMHFYWIKKNIMYLKFQLVMYHVFLQKY